MLGGRRIAFKVHDGVIHAGAPRPSPRVVMVKSLVDRGTVIKKSDK